jgi:cupin fold WbuC family metalloprotein
MPNLVYSVKEKGLLLLVINRYDEISNDRIDLCPESEYLQVCTKRMESGTTFKPHKHNPLERTTTKTQEGWIILEGKVKASFWDIDDKKIHETVLEKGDCAVVFHAGHSFEVLERGTILYEFKTGPYYGQEKDKTFIGEKNEI